MIDDGLVEVVTRLFKRAHTSLPKDVVESLEKAFDVEESELARTQLRNILDNVSVAGRRGIPMCQDTGTPLVYVKFGGDSGVDLNGLYESVSLGIVNATEEVPLRRHLVNPLTRENVTDGISDYRQFIHLEVVPNESYVEVTCLPKGGGSENTSRLGMLKPTAGAEGVTEFVVETVKLAGGKPCPPTIVGVGVGGTSDIAASFAKNAIMRPVNISNADASTADLEGVMLEKINALGLGPMALGGKTTALAVSVETAPCNTNGLPVAVNLQCWAARMASARLQGGEVEWLR